MSSSASASDSGAIRNAPVVDDVGKRAAGAQHHERAELSVVDGTDDELRTPANHRLYEQLRRGSGDRCGDIGAGRAQVRFAGDAQAHPADIGLVHPGGGRV